MEQFPLEPTPPEELAAQDSTMPNPLFHGAKKWMKRNLALLGAVGVGLMGSPGEAKGGEIQHQETSASQTDFGVNERLAETADHMVKSGKGTYREIVHATYGDQADAVLKAKREYRKGSGEFFASRIDDASLDRVARVKTGGMKGGSTGGAYADKVVIDQKKVTQEAGGFQDARMVRKDVVDHEMVHFTQDLEHIDGTKGEIALHDKELSGFFGDAREREARVADLNRINLALVGRPVLSPQDSIRALLAFSEDIVSFDEARLMFQKAGIEYSRAEYDQALKDSAPMRAHKQGITTANGLYHIWGAFIGGKLSETEKEALLKSIVFTAPGLASNSSSGQVYIS